MGMTVFYVSIAAESNSDIRFSPSGPGFAAHEITIFLSLENNRKPKNHFLEAVDDSHTFDNF